SPKRARTISHLLHPPLLDEVGFASVLRLFLEGFRERSESDIDFAKSLMISDVCLAIWRQRSSVSFKNRSQMSIDTQAAPLQECGLPGRRLTFFSRLQTKAKEYRPKNDRPWRPGPRWASD